MVELPVSRYTGRSLAFIPQSSLAIGLATLKYFYVDGSSRTAQALETNETQMASH
jgi:hypothetical protein